MRGYWAVIALVLFAFGLSYISSTPTANAAVGINKQINFQGKLVNPNGTNVTDGSYSIIFSIYTVASAGTNIWTETQSVTVTNGIFQVNLGSVTALPGTVDFNTDNIYLGIKVGADAEMTPRVQFTSVPQAFNSEKLGGLDKTGFIQNGTGVQATSNFNISGTGIAGNGFTTPLLQAASGVALTITGNAASTWSTSAGNLTLQAGSGTVSLGSSTTLSSTGALTVSSGTGTNAITLDSGATGNVNIGTGAAAKTIQLGTTTGAVVQTINIGTNNTASSTSNVLIGSVVAGTTTIQNSATINLNAGTVVGNATTQNVFNTVATTLNIGGAATSITLGATTGTLTVRNASTALEGSLSVAGGLVATPGTPTIVGNTATDSSNTDVPDSIAVQGKYAYVTSITSDTFTVIDISNPAAPIRIATIGGVGNIYFDGATGLVVAGGFAYVSASTTDRVTAVNISNPFQPYVAGSITSATQLDSVKGLYLSGKYIYATARLDDRITAIDITIPNAPVITGSSAVDSIDTNDPYAITVQGKYAYVAVRLNSAGATTTTGLAVFDISNPANITRVGLLKTASLTDARGIYTSGRYVYLTGYASTNVVIIDVADPSAPVEVGSISDATNLNAPANIFVAGRYAYVTALTGDRFTILDVSIPATPTVLKSITSTTQLDGVSGITLSGRYAYVTASTDDMVSIVDLNYELPAADIGSLGAGTLQVRDDTTLGNSLYVGGSANIGGSLQVAGASSLQGTTIISQGDLIVTGFGVPAQPTVATGSNQGGTLVGTSGTTYYYRITAVSASGESVASLERSFAATSFTAITAPTAPTVAINATAGNLNGTYTYKITYVTANGETTGGTTSAAVAPVSQQVNLTNIPLGPAGTTQRKIYRTTAGGADGTQKFVATLADNTTTTYTDNTADASLVINDPATNTARTDTNNATVTFTTIPGATSYNIYRSTTSGSTFSSYQTADTLPYTPFSDNGAASTSQNVPTFATAGKLAVGTATPLANLDIRGNALFRNSTNSFSAFSIQNDFSTILFNVDTLTNRTTIGSNLTVGGFTTFNYDATFDGGLTVGTGQSFTINSDAFTDLTGSGLSVSSGALTVDSTSSTGFIRNGGNNFGASATIGTNDAFDLQLKTAGATRLTVSTAGNLAFSQGGVVGGGVRSITVNTNSAADGVGYTLNLTAGAASGSTTGAVGGALALQGGSAAGTGNNNGGNVTLDGGAKTGTGTIGNIVLQGSGGNVGIGTAAPTTKLDVMGDATAAGTQWISRTSASDNDWNGLAYGNGLFVAVSTTGTGNRVMTSPDGITWTSRTSATDNNWIDVTFGNGLFVAVSSTGTGNRVMTSPDGITWTSRTSATDNSWTSVTYGNGLFVAVAQSGTGNRVMTSPNGITWTSRTNPINNSWMSVTYGNGMFVAVAASGTANRVMTSPDGITWTSRTSAADNSWFSVTYGNGTFVAVAQTGTGNRVMTSTNGISWTIRTSAADNSWNSVTYGNGLFVAVSGSGVGNRVMSSPNGITWTLRTSSADNNWGDVTYGNGTFVATASSGTGNRVMTSTGAETYAPALQVSGAVRTSGDLTVMSTGSSKNALDAWTSRTSSADHSWNDIAYGNSTFVALGYTPGIGNQVMTSPDGITWTTRTSAADNAWYGLTYGNGLFVAVSYSGAGNRVMTSSDGITWTVRTSAADNQWYSVTYGNGLYVAVAGTGTGNRVMTSPTGTTWTSRTSAADNDWVSVTYGNGLFVAVSGTGTGNRVMTSPDGITWTSRTSAVDNTWTSVTYGNGLFVAVAQSGTGNRVMTSPDGITWTSRTNAADNSWRDVTYGDGLFVAVSSSGTGNRIMTSPDGITWTSSNSAADNGWQGVTYGENKFVAVSDSGTGNRVMTSQFVELNDTALSVTSATGQVAVGSGGLLVQGSAYKVGATIMAASGQVADLLQIQNSASAVLFNVTADGNVGIGSATNPAGVKLNVVGGDIRVGGSNVFKVNDNGEFGYDGGTNTVILQTIGTEDLSFETGGLSRFKISNTGTATFTGAVVGSNFGSATATALLLDSGTTGALNIGTAANAKTITIGNTTGATQVNVLSGTGGIALTGDVAFTQGTNRKLSVGTSSTNVVGSSLTIEGGAAGAGATARAGGNLVFQGGDAAGTTGNAAGGSVILKPGAKVGSARGYVDIQDDAGNVNFRFDPTNTSSLTCGLFLTNNCRIQAAAGTLFLSGGTGGGGISFESNQGGATFGGFNTSGTLSVGTSSQFQVTSAGNISTSGSVTLSALSTNGFVKTSGGTGALSVSSSVALATEVSGTLSNTNLTGSGALTVTAGTGLGGGGSVALGGSTTLNLANTTVSANSYGSASSVATFNVNAQGQLTTAASTAIAINGNQITTGSVAANFGGTGLTSYAVGDLLYASGTTTIAKLAAVSNGQILISNGIGAAPSYTGAPTLSTSLTVPLLTSATATTLLIDSGTTGALNIGTGANAKTITLGNSTGATGVFINSGTGGTALASQGAISILAAASGTASIDVNGTGNVNVGNGAAAKTITIGNGTGATAVNIQSGTGGVTLGTNAVNKAIDIGAVGTTANTTTVNIANSTGAAQTLSIGSTTTTSTTTIQAGTGNINLIGNGAANGVVIKPTVDSSRAFQIQDASAAPVFNVSTLDTNLLGALNAGFEANPLTSWVGKGAGSIVRYSTQFYTGNNSGRITMTAAIGDGAQVPYTFAANTQYTLSLYAKMTTGTMTTFLMGRQDISGTDVDCAAGANVVSTGWTRLTCTFTTGPTITSSNIYVKQTTAVARAGTLMIDAVQLETGAFASAFGAGALQLNAPITSPLNVMGASNSTTAFTVQNSTGSVDILVVDTVNNRVNVGGGLTVTGQITSSVTTGTAPLVVASTTKVANLQADTLDGFEGASFVQIQATTPGTAQTGNININGAIIAGSTITGTTINGTTGINTGAGAGTNRITAGGNLVNIGSYTGTGDIVTTGDIITLGPSNQSLTLQSGPRSHGFEIGRTDGVGSTPYFDLHSGATNVDHDVRLIASGGTGVIGEGSLGIIAKTVGLGTTSPGTRLSVFGGNNIDNRHPDGFGGRTVIKSVLQNCAFTYTVPVGKTLYIETATAPSGTQILLAGGLPLMYISGARSFETPLIFPAGTVLSNGAGCFSYENIHFTGFTVTADVTAQVVELLNCGTYTVPAGKVFTVGNGYSSIGGYYIYSSNGNWLYSFGTSGTSLESPLLLPANTVINAQDVNANCNSQTVLNGYLSKSDGSGGADLAERYFAEGKLEPGDVVRASVNSTKNKATVTKSFTAYDPTALGVVTTQPNQIYEDETTRDSNAPKADVALTGRVPVKVSGENGPIKVGDPIAPSSTPGVAMKATEAGRIIGTALASSDCATADCVKKVLTFVHLDSYTPKTKLVSHQTMYYAPWALIALYVAAKQLRRNPGILSRTKNKI